MIPKSPQPSLYRCRFSGADSGLPGVLCGRPISGSLQRDGPLRHGAVPRHGATQANAPRKHVGSLSLTRQMENQWNINILFKAPPQRKKHLTMCRCSHHFFWKTSVTCNLHSFLKVPRSNPYRPLNWDVRARHIVYSASLSSAAREKLTKHFRDSVDALPENPASDEDYVTAWWFHYMEVSIVIKYD